MKGDFVKRQPKFKLERGTIREDAIEFVKLCKNKRKYLLKEFKKWEKRGHYLKTSGDKW